MLCKKEEGILKEKTVGKFGMRGKALVGKVGLLKEVLLHQLAPLE
jgi:hypothetical protein